MPALPQKRIGTEWWSTKDGRVKLWHGHVVDVLAQMPAGSVQCCVTSPPYWGLRDYGVQGQIGVEERPDCLGWANGNPCGTCFVCHMVEVFRGVRRALRDDGVLWLNLGDTYGGGNSGQYDFSSSTLKKDGRSEESRLRTLNERAKELNRPRTGPAKVKSHLPAGNLVGIPWRVALALQADGWVLRSDVPWLKRNAMPESCRNRPAKALEYWFMLVKGKGYWFDMDAVKKPSPTGGKVGGGFTDRPALAIGKAPSGNQLKENDAAYVRPDDRNFRNADLWFDSVDPPHGMTGVGDEIVGMDVPLRPYPGAHFAVFNEHLIRPLIRCASKPGSVVLDPFVGSGTTVAVAMQEGRQGWGIDLSEKYLRENALPRITAALPREPVQGLQVGKVRLGG